MATLEQMKQGPAVRRTRYFSEDFRKKKVEEVEKKLTTVAQICKEYEVSHAAVYKWIYKYSLMRKKAVKMVVEAQSDTVKIQALKDHITQLEQLLGKKQFELEFMEKQIQIASQLYGIDLKKKPSGKVCDGSGNSETNTPTP